MTRLMKWSVGVAIILGLIYLALVAITGTKMREIAEQQLAAINEQEPEIEARIEWQETGFWSSSGVVNVDVDEAGLQFTHTINLRHGALRAGVSGEVTAIIDGFNINNQLFSEQPITIDGHVGLGGLSLTYHIPGIQYQDSGLGLEYQTAPFDLDVVLRDQDSHSQFTIDWVEISTSLHGPNSIDRIEGLHMTAQTSLSAADGQFEHGVTKMVLDTFTSREGDAQMSMIQGASLETEVQRERDEVTMQSRFEVAEYEMYGINGNLTVALHTTAMPFSGFLAWQQQSGDIEAISELLEALRDYGTQLVIDEFDLSLGEMGKVAAHGHVKLREDIEFASAGDSVADYIQGELTIQDLPVMLMMPLSGLVSGELPWTLAIQEGNLTINGEPLELP